MLLFIQCAWALWMIHRTGACCCYNSSSPLPSPVPVCVTTSSGRTQPPSVTIRFAYFFAWEAGRQDNNALQLWRSSLDPQESLVRCFSTDFDNTSSGGNPEVPVFTKSSDATGRRVCICVPTRSASRGLLPLPQKLRHYPDPCVTRIVESDFYITEFGDRGSTVVKVLATNRKVAGSIPDGVIGIFHWHTPSDRIMALGSTQPLTEISISWG